MALNISKNKPGVLGRVATRGAGFLRFKRRLDGGISKTLNTEIFGYVISNSSILSGLLNI